MKLTGDPLFKVRLTCPSCGREWVATIHEDQDIIGCPNCGSKGGVDIRRRAR